MDEVADDIKKGFDRLEKRLDQFLWLLIAFYALVVAWMIAMAIEFG